VAVTIPPSASPRQSRGPGNPSYRKTQPSPRNRHAPRAAARQNTPSRTISPVLQNKARCHPVTRHSPGAPHGATGRNKLARRRKTKPPRAPITPPLSPILARIRSCPALSLPTYFCIAYFTGTRAGGARFTSFNAGWSVCRRVFFGPLSATTFWKCKPRRVRRVTHRAARAPGYPRARRRRRSGEPALPTMNILYHHRTQGTGNASAGSGKTE